jgi:hypothetical protein
LTANTGAPYSTHMDTNWQAIIKDLNATGLSYAAIAQAVNSKASTIGDLASGRSKAPVGMTAVLLWKMHQRKIRPAKAA